MCSSTLYSEAMTPTTVGPLLKYAFEGCGYHEAKQCHFYRRMGAKCETAKGFDGFAVSPTYLARSR